MLVKRLWFLYMHDLWRSRTAVFFFLQCCLFLRSVRLQSSYTSTFIMHQNCLWPLYFAVSSLSWTDTHTNKNKNLCIPQCTGSYATCWVDMSGSSTFVCLCMTQASGRPDAIRRDRRIEWKWCRPFLFMSIAPNDQASVCVTSPASTLFLIGQDRAIYRKCILKSPG